jgi:hypothetical protein
MQVPERAGCSRGAKSWVRQPALSAPERIGLRESRFVRQSVWFYQHLVIAKGKAYLQTLFTPIFEFIAECRNTCKHISR